MVQVQLEAVSEKHFQPLDNQLCISTKNPAGLNRKHKDKRSAVARLWRQAHEMSKPQMLESMLKRALRKGFRAPYWVADSWYSSKKIMSLVRKSILKCFTCVAGFLCPQRNPYNHCSYPFDTQSLELSLGIFWC